MGVLGSGPQNPGKQTVDNAYAIDAGVLARRAAFARLPRAMVNRVCIPGPTPPNMHAVFVPADDGYGGILRLYYTARVQRGHGSSVLLEIAVVTMPLTYGGVRRWFRCPVIGQGGMPCARRCRIVYLPPSAWVFGCRQCHDLAYESQRLSPVDRIVRRVNRLERELGWDRGLGNRRPRGMHRKRYKRLMEEFYEADHAWLSALHHRLARLTVPNSAPRPDVTSPQE